MKTKFLLLLSLVLGATLEGRAWGKEGNPIYSTTVEGVELVYEIMYEAGSEDNPGLCKVGFTHKSPSYWEERYDEDGNYYEEYVEGEILYYEPALTSYYQGSLTIPSIVYDEDGLPYTVGEINDQAFMGSSITSITLPGGLYKIGNRAFYGSSIETINYTMSQDSWSSSEGEYYHLTNIGDEAFGYSYLQTAFIPPRVTEMGKNIFIGCSSLTSIEIGTEPWPSSYWNNPKYESRDNCNAIIDKNTNTLLFGCKNSFIPYGVVAIADSAFYEVSLRNIVIPSSIKRIGERAFSGCYLKNMTIYADGIDVASNSFENIYSCNVYSSPKFDYGTIISNSSFKWGNGTFIYCGEPYAQLASDGETLTFYSDKNKSSRNGTTFLLNKYKSDPEWLSNASTVKKVVFDESFKAMPNSTYRWFSGMEDLTEIEGMENLNTSMVNNMGEMFSDCIGLTNLDLSSFNTSNVTDLGKTFYNCYNLKSLDVSKFNTSKVTSLYYTFYNCSGLTELDVSHFNTSRVLNFWSTFEKCRSLTSLDVTNFDTSESRNFWGTFKDCSRLTNIDLSSFQMLRHGVLEWGDLLAGCSNLKSLTLPLTMATNYIQTIGCRGVGTPEAPCLIYAPDDFDFGVDTSGDYFVWEDGYFCFERHDTLSVKPAMAFRGATSFVEVNLCNATRNEYNGFQFDISLPEDFSLATNDQGGYQYVLGNRFSSDKMNVSVTNTEGSTYRVVCFSLTNATITGRDGVIIRLGITAEESIGERDYEGVVKNIMLSTTDGENVQLENATYTITVSDFALGDVNHDGLVTVTDAMLLVNQILGSLSPKYHAENADINGDGYVNISDVSGIVDIIINATYQAAPSNASLVSADALHIDVSSEGYILNMDDVGNYSAFQMDIRLPQGSSFRDVRLCKSIMNSHHVITKDLGNGLIRVVVLSKKGAFLNDCGDGLLRINVIGRDVQDLQLTNIQFTDRNFDTVTLNDVHGTTGVTSIMKDLGASPLYNLQGTKAKESDKGIVIQDGKKYIHR